MPADLRSRIGLDPGASDEAAAGAGMVTSVEHPKKGVLRRPSARFGVLIAAVLTIVVFSVLRPHTFAQWSNVKNILDAAAIPAVLAVGLTIALVMGDFDLSIGATIGLTMGIAVKLMSSGGVPWELACVLTLCAGVLIGLVNGGLVSYVGLNSFIATLATGSVITGIEGKLTGDNVIYQGIPAGFGHLGTGTLLGISYPVWIAVGVTLLLWVLMHQTEPGRYMYAIGGNREASFLAGLSVKRLRVIGFVMAGVCAAGAGILLGASTNSYYPSSGPGLLLPAYAAAFLGATASASVKFKVLGTILGVLFLGVIESGLSLLNAQAWVVSVVQGVVLVGAVTMARLESRR
jgi:ribose transport system permease protein